MAAIVSLNISYIVLTFIPPLLWLIFYLREDCHPEPKRLLLLTFVGGMGAAIIAVVVELALVGEGGFFSRSIMLETRPFLFFLVIGLVEEYVKYWVVKMLVLKRPNFDEPVDAMIYMMTSALGFAALENALFIFPIFQTSILSGFEIAANRFLGANLLHALSSGIVGFFLARAFFRPRRHHFVALGIVIATLLHTFFNYLILGRGIPNEGTSYTIYIILLLSTMAAMVFADFERLKQKVKKFIPPQEM